MSNITSLYINALRYWVTEEERGLRKNKNGKLINNKTVDERITELVHMMPPLKESITVYRGQQNSNTIYPRNWFSTTDVKEKAKDFAGKDCCLFKIYVQPGIHIIDVHKFLQKHYTGITRHEDEHEIILEGNGDFYKDIDKKERGFKEVKGELVAYYFPKSKNNNKSKNILNTKKNNTNKNRRNTKKNNIKLDSKRILNRIPEDEYDLIDTIDDIRSFLQNGESVNNSVLEEVLEKIKAT